jgi:hypothetical protein
LHVGRKPPGFQGWRESEDEIVAFAGRDLLDGGAETLRADGCDLGGNWGAVTTHDRHHTLARRIVGHTTEVDELWRHAEGFEKLPLANQFFLGMLRVVGDDDDVPAELSLELAAGKGDGQVFSLPRSYRTIRRTVELGPSATSGADAQISRARVADVERERKTLLASPHRLRGYRLLIAGPLRLRIHREV